MGPAPSCGGRRRSACWNAQGAALDGPAGDGPGLCLLQGKGRRESEDPKNCGRPSSRSPSSAEKRMSFESESSLPEVSGRWVGCGWCVDLQSISRAVGHGSPSGSVRTGIAPTASRGLGVHVSISRQAPFPCSRKRAPFLGADVIPDPGHLCVHRTTTTVVGQLNHNLWPKRQEGRAWILHLWLCPQQLQEGKRD